MDSGASPRRLCLSWPRRGNDHWKPRRTGVERRETDPARRCTRNDFVRDYTRAVDLLVSASGFAVATEGADTEPESHLRRLAGTPLGAMAEMRREALQRMLRGLDTVRFDARHLRLGPYAIHLATGRVTRDGEPVAVDLAKETNRSARPWLPYDEKLLERIYWTAIEVAVRLSALAR
jgi:hypothetical protein